MLPRTIAVRSDKLYMPPSKGINGLYMRVIEVLYRV